MEYISSYFSELGDVLKASADLADAIANTAEKLIACFKAGNKLLLCGNGGSAADCQHVATELVSRLTRDFDRPGLPAIALTTDTSFLTAFGNDVSFDGIFARQVQALGKRGDALVGISTSGNSTNVVKAFEVARALGITTIALTGNSGRLKEIADEAVAVPSQDTQHIQETLLPIEHMLCHLIERALYPRDGSS
jgi:D-sedoheptulose 7-phosphate isomerase